MLANFLLRDLAIHVLAYNILYDSSMRNVGDFGVSLHGPEGRQPSLDFCLFVFMFTFGKRKRGRGVDDRLWVLL